MADPVVRTCARDGCDREFSPKPKGMKQIYCSNSCRSFAYQKGLPPEARRKWWSDYYYSHQEQRQAAARDRAISRRRNYCECGNPKPSAQAEMCDTCAVMPSVNEVLKG